MYADTDFWLAILKDDDWLAGRAEERLSEYRDDLKVSLATFIELFLVEERFAFDRDQATLSILELADADVHADAVFQASEYVDDGLSTYDAFHAALAGEAILSSDTAYDSIPIERIPLEPE